MIAITTNISIMVNPRGICDMPLEKYSRLLIEVNTTPNKVLIQKGVAHKKAKTLQSNRLKFISI